MAVFLSRFPLLGRHEQGLAPQMGWVGRLYLSAMGGHHC